MRTKLGKALLKVNTKKMDELNRELIHLAEELNGMSPSDQLQPRINSHGERSYFSDFMYRVQNNREEYQRLQDEINLIVSLEHRIPYAKG